MEPQVKALEKLLRENTKGGQRDLRDVFRDFVTICALTLSNSCDPRMFESREHEYFTIIAGYDREELERFAHGLALLAQALETTRSDVLGVLWMLLGLGSSDLGQFFTPAPVARLMAELQVGDGQELLAERDEITVFEPACGAGVMLLEMIAALREAGVDVEKRVVFTANDVSRDAVLMCYVQLALVGAQAVVHHQNTLTMETLGEPWCTPAYMRAAIVKKLTQSADPREEEHP